MSRNATVQFGFYYVCELYDAAAVYGVFLVSSCFFLWSNLCNFQCVYALCIGGAV